MGDKMNILFTGAASGIARKTIEKIKNRNIHIFISVHTEKQLERIKKIYQYDDNITCLKIDITKKKDCEKVKNLDIDVLICNAAIGESGSIVEMDIERIRKNFEVNVFGHFELVQLILEKMIKKQKGRVIMMSSLAGMMPIPFLGSYCATKASILKLTETMQLEMSLLKYPIDIICVMPGLYDTGFNRVMFENKYPSMDKKTYFKEEIDVIRRRENYFLTFLEKKKFESVIKIMEQSIFASKPKKIYKSPLLQAIGAKLYILLFE